MALPELDQALELVDDFCTKEQVTALLRRYRENDDVKISSPTKDGTINQNLKEALTSGAIPMSEVFDLIREGEENGSQHIWFYRPKPGLSALFDADAVASRLWGQSWKQQIEKLPSLTLKPEDFVISDFRRSTKKPKDWFLKIYGHATVVVATGGLDERENGLFWREFKNESLRSVILIRWNSPDLLEVRVQKHGSRKRMAEWLNVAWNILKPAFLRDQFRPWSLEKVLGNLVRDCQQYAQLYEFRDAKIVEADGTVQATYETISDQGNLLESKSTAKELQQRLKSGDTLKGLTVTWKSGKTALSEELKTLVAAQEPNEVFISAHCSAKDLDHVTDQLRRFS